MGPSAKRAALVIKVGGTAGLDYAAICQDVADLIISGKRAVLVHGGSAEASALGAALGHEARWLTSPSGFRWRYTDRATLEIFAMATNGKVNTLLVERLQAVGVDALGLCGLDGRLLQARRKDVVQSVENGKRRLVRDDFTGKVERVNVALLNSLLDQGYTPVIAPLALGGAAEPFLPTNGIRRAGPGGAAAEPFVPTNGIRRAGPGGPAAEGQAVNVDADRAAAMIAGALSAATLVLLTAAPGLMRAFPDETTLIPRLRREQWDEALAMAQGGMKKKVLGAREALEGGVGRVIIADGRVAHPIAAALAGRGTTFD